MDRRIVLATGNAGKLKEIRDIFSSVEIDIVAQSEFATPEAIEDGLSFVENAIIKARACQRPGACYHPGRLGRKNTGSRTG
jgi:XTP/dITP diphosphohydrolase